MVLHAQDKWEKPFRSLIRAATKFKKINVNHFFADFNSQNLTMKAYSIGSISKRFVDLPTNACGYAKCPVVSGEKQTFKYGLKVLSSYPDGTYEVKWLLGGDGGEQCCFIFNIQIKR